MREDTSQVRFGRRDMGDDHRLLKRVLTVGWFHDHPVHQEPDRDDVSRCSSLFGRSTAAVLIKVAGVLQRLTMAPKTA